MCWHQLLSLLYPWDLELNDSTKFNSKSENIICFPCSDGSVFLLVLNQCLIEMEVTVIGLWQISLFSMQWWFWFTESGVDVLSPQSPWSRRHPTWFTASWLHLVLFLRLYGSVFACHAYVVTWTSFLILLRAYSLDN